MKEVLGKILKGVVFLALFGLLVLLVFGFVLWLDWPWWVGLCLLLGLCGLGLGVIFVRRLLLRRREQRFVQEIIAQDEAFLRRTEGPEKDRLKELQARWKEAVDTLKRSRLRKYGHPLYVLPWYLIIGESGSGKTTAIKSANLSSPLADTRTVSGISGTRNFEWWFFEQAIILDTAGRYAIPVDEGRDKEEWQKFLSLLAKYRKKEPLNGLIVTISADKLLEGKKEALEEEARELRRRIEELMRALGVKVPTYLLVTKCDLIQGMTEFCNELPENLLKQAMGMLNEEGTTNVEAFVRRTVAAVGERLRDLQLLILQKTREVKPELLLFPQEFRCLEEGLVTFARTLFEENPYQETPYLRGIYFSSGRQEGTPYSHFLKAMGLLEERQILPGTSRGLFLHDFFARILPRDRWLLVPTQKAQAFKSFTQNIGLMAWVALGLAICGLLGFSFYKNLVSLRKISRTFSQPPMMSGEFVTDLATMDQFFQALKKVEEYNRHWWVPRFGLHQSEQVETKLKVRYCQWFKKYFLDPTDRKLASLISKNVSEEVFLIAIPHLVNRINLLDLRLQGKDLEEVGQENRDYVSWFLGETESQELEKKFNQLYLYYLIWNTDTQALAKEKFILQGWLKHLVAQKGANLRWLVKWVERSPEVTPITLATYWGGGRNLADEPSISPAYTRQGQEMIQDFIGRMEKALPDALLITPLKEDFEQWYTRRREKAWFNFARAFHKGVLRLEGEEEWQQAAMKMTQKNNPYFAFLADIAENFSQETKKKPRWIILVLQIKKIQQEAAHEGLLKTKGVLGKTAQKGQKLFKKLSGVTGGTGGKLAREFQASAVYLEYTRDLRKLERYFSVPNLAYQTLSLLFKGELSQEKSPLLKAQNELIKMRSLLGAKSREEAVVWRILGGPVHFFWQYLSYRAACYLQDRWDRDVLAEVQGTGDWESIRALLMGPQGKVWQFVKGPAEPFVCWRPGKGYYACKAEGLQLPFEPKFFTFLNKGSLAKQARKASYQVIIRGLPTDSNNDAKVKPHATVLELQCASGPQVLVNRQYPIQKVFKWEPDNCGDVIFKIEVANMSLTKVYSGSQGFPKFLVDFRGGQHTFYPKDFPEATSDLKRLNIKFIRVKYAFSGQKPVIRFLQESPAEIPQKIVRCWD